LDISGIKRASLASWRSVGAVAGGLLGGWLVFVTGRTESLLLATAVAQALFALLVLVTERRHPAELAGSGRGGTTIERQRVADDPAAAPSTRRLLRSRFVALILAYQVLSALGSQLSDFLVLDRATAQYPATADLARFMAGYTAVMNAVAIAFLFVLAGPLLRRFGLRLGVVANPFVVTILAVGMLVVHARRGQALGAARDRLRDPDRGYRSRTARHGPRSTRCTRSCRVAAAWRSRPPSKGSSRLRSASQAS
jgi:hypothetical protein